VQLIGFVAIFVNIISVQFNTYKKIILLKAVGSILFATQYLLLGAYAGMVMDLIGTVRNVIFTRVVQKGKSTKPYIILFSILTFVLGVITIVTTWDKSLQAVSRWSSNVTIATILVVLISVLSVSAKLLSTIAYGINNPHAIRMLNLPSSSCWIVYNLVVFSLAGIFNEILVISSIIIAEIRFKKDKKVNNIEGDNNEQN
jgi:hypothetical protein